MIEAVINLRKNNIETYDSFVNPLMTTDIEDSFYDIGSISGTSVKTPPFMSNTVYQLGLYLYQEQITHVREIYDILGVLGNLGGISEIFLLIFGIVAFPYSQFSYYLKVIEKLYLVRTCEIDLFKNGKSKKKNGKTKFKTLKTSIPTMYDHKEIVKEVGYHHAVKLTLYNELKLYFLTQFGWICCHCVFPCCKSK